MNAPMSNASVALVHLDNQDVMLKTPSYVIIVFVTGIAVPLLIVP
jgi:hypothetical protein